MAYAVVQLGYCVFGTGETKSAAIEDARPWVDNPDTLQDDIIDHCEATVGDLLLVKCTDELVERVQRDGGDVLFDVLDGTATLCTLTP